MVEMGGIQLLGIILCTLTALLMAFIVLFHYFVVLKFKLAYRIFHSYYYFLVVSLFCIIYFIAFRWEKDINDFFEYIKNGNDDTSIYNHSIAYSKAFLLDLCPAVAFILPLSLIIDKTRTIAKCIAPYAVIGSIITIYSTCLVEEVPNDQIWEYIFLGLYPNEIFFMMHFLSLLLAISVMLTSKNYTIWSVIGSILFIGCYLMYISFFMVFAGVKYNTTGLSPNDWITDEPGAFSEYGLVTQILNLKPPIIQVLCYSVAVMVQISLQLIKNGTTRDQNKIIDLNNMWYSKIFAYKPIYLEENFNNRKLDTNINGKMRNNKWQFLKKINNFIYKALSSIDYFIYNKLFKNIKRKTIIY